MSNPSFLFEYKDEQELEQLKTKTLKLKVILLDKIGKHPLANVSLLDRREKNRITTELRKLWDEMTDTEIDAEFNDIVANRLLAEGVDISNYPCYEVTHPTPVVEEPNVQEIPQNE